MICLNSVIDPTTRTSATFRHMGASTPVVSNWDVVRMTGNRPSRSWNRLRKPAPMSPSSAVTRAA